MLWMSGSSVSTQVFIVQSSWRPKWCILFFLHHIIPQSTPPTQKKKKKCNGVIVTPKNTPSGKLKLYDSIFTKKEKKQFMTWQHHSTLSRMIKQLGESHENKNNDMTPPWHHGRSHYKHKHLPNMWETRKFLKTRKRKSSIEMCIIRLIQKKQGICCTNVAPDVWMWSETWSFTYIYVRQFSQVNIRLYFLNIHKTEKQN